MGKSNQEICRIVNIALEYYREGKIDISFLESVCLSAYKVLFPQFDQRELKERISNLFYVMGV